jgi:putative ABC transport system substrate-binding protein
MAERCERKPWKSREISISHRLIGTSGRTRVGGAWDRRPRSPRAALVILLLLALGGIPTPIGAQQESKIARIGLLAPASPDAAAILVQAFRQGLRGLGYVEGKTFVLEVRYGEGKAERLSQLARELVGLKVDVIVTIADVATAAAKRETRTIPIVMAGSIDPVGAGLVASLARPGGNITGLSNVSSELSGKRLELLKEAVPGLVRVAVLWNPDVRGAILEYKEAEAAARSLRLEVQSQEVSSFEDLDRAFSTVLSQRPQALILVGQNPVSFSRRTEIASFALRNRLPSIYPSPAYVDAGGLMSYGQSISDGYRRTAIYVDKILKGVKPADLPVEQPTKFELTINLKAAKALGLTVPRSLLQRADRLIE